MRDQSQGIATRAMEKRRNGLPKGATDCRTVHVRAASGIWPEKTAENWAEAAGVKPRMVQYWLAGYKVSDAGRLALIRLLT